MAVTSEVTTEIDAGALLAGRRKYEDDEPGRKKRPFATRMKEILVLAVPLIALTMWMRITMVADAFITAQLSPRIMAAVVQTGLLIALAAVPAGAIVVVVQTRAARNLGSASRHDTGQTVATGLFMAVGATVVLAILIYAFAPFMHGRRGELAAVGVDYLRLRMLSFPAVAASLVFAGFWMGEGKPWRSFVILVVSQTIDIVLSYYLALGPPAMGVTGAALGSVAGEVTSLLLHLALWLTYAHREGVRLSMPTRAEIKNVWANSNSFAVRSALRPTYRLALMWVMSLLSPAEFIVGSLLMRLRMFMSAPAGGLGRAGAILVGRDIGANRPERARQRTGDVTRVAVYFLGSLGLLTALFATDVLGFFLKDPVLVGIGVAPLLLLCMSMPAMAVQASYNRSMIALGSGKPLNLRVLLPFVVMLPASWFFGVWLGWGLLGIFGLEALARLVRGVQSWRAATRRRGRFGRAASRDDWDPGFSSLD